MVELFSRARLNLGFATVGETHAAATRITQVRLRDFEVPMSGGFYLAEHSEELAEFFRPGVEIETWRTREELRDKCRFYLRDDEARRRIAVGRPRPRPAEHTWEHRFAAAFREMDLGMNTPPVTVIMPVRNAAAYVLQAARSVLGQTLRDLSPAYRGRCLDRWLRRSSSARWMIRGYASSAATRP